jgi:hypothetical protein
MSDILTRILSSIRSDGLSKTLAKCFRYPFRRDQDPQFSKVMRHGTPAQIFSEIYKKMDIGAARKARAVRGPPWTIANLRQHLPQLFNRGLRERCVFGLVDRDRNRARRQTLRRPLRATSRRQPRPACGRRRAAADRCIECIFRNSLRLRVAGITCNSASYRRSSALQVQCARNDKLKVCRALTRGSAGMQALASRRGQS